MIDVIVQGAALALVVVYGWAAFAALVRGYLDKKHRGDAD